MNGFFIRCKCRFRRFTGSKSRDLHAADGGKDRARRAAELRSVALPSESFVGIFRENRLHIGKKYAIVILNYIHYIARPADSSILAEEQICGMFGSRKATIRQIIAEHTQEERLQYAKSNEAFAPGDAGQAGLCPHRLQWSPSICRSRLSRLRLFFQVQK